MSREELTSLVAQAASDAGGNMKGLSKRTGIGYEIARPWASGRHSQKPEGVIALKGTSERRSERPTELGHELRNAVTEG